MNSESLPLPCDLEVEKAVIGLWMQNIVSNYPELINITQDHFYGRNNAILFNLINQLRKEGSEIDPIMITSKLSDLKILDEVGGAFYVSSCISYQAECYPSKYYQILEEKRILRKLIELSAYTKGAAYSNTETETIIDTIGKELISFQTKSTNGNLLPQTTIEVVSMIDRRIAGEKTLGLKTGISTWDNVLGGLNPRYYSICARGGGGKTALMEQMIDKLLSDNHPVLAFAKDMSCELFILRMACRRASVSFMRYDLGYCNKFELEQIKKHALDLSNSPFYLYSPANLTAEKFSSIVQLEKTIHNIEAVFLDHVLNLEVGKDYRVGLTQASTRIRASCQETKIAHVILAQLNRGAHSKERPTAANIKEFDALYADCDAMILLWSDKDVHEIPKDELFPVKFTIEKNRYGTKLEDELGFDRSTMTFKERLRYGN